MSYEAIAKEAANLSQSDKIALIAYLSNMLNAQNMANKDTRPKDYRHTYPKGFFDLFGSVDDPSFVEPEDIPIELDGDVIF